MRGCMYWHGHGRDGRARFRFKRQVHGVFDRYQSRRFRSCSERMAAASPPNASRAEALAYVEEQDLVELLNHGVGRCRRERNFKDFGG